jgi:hypothetical protein
MVELCHGLSVDCDLFVAEQGFDIITAHLPEVVNEEGKECGCFFNLQWYVGIHLVIGSMRAQRSAKRRRKENFRIIWSCAF